MQIEQNIIERMQQLVAEGEELRKGTEFDQVLSHDHGLQCNGWLASAINLVEIIFPNEKSAYRKRVSSIVFSNGGYVVNQAVGGVTEIMKRLLEDIDLGLLSSLLNKAHAEIFDDFLDHAKGYYADNRKNESGVIAGVVFEDSLRRICRLVGMDDKGVQLDDIITELTKNGTLSQAKAKRARAAAHVRTKATHAQWDEFELDDVKACIEFTENLILTYLDN